MTVAGDEEDRISDSIKGVKWMPGVGEMRESKVETNAPSVYHRHSCHSHTTCRSVNLCHALLVPAAALSLAFAGLWLI